MESSSNSNSRIKKEIKEDPPHYNLVEIGSVKLEPSSNGTQQQQRQQRGNNHNQSTTTQAAQFQQQQQQSTAAYFQPQQQQNGLHPASMNANNGAFNGAGANANNNGHQMLGGPEAMQAFANLGLFGHQQFPGGIMPSAPACVPPHLAAAAAAAAYGQRLIGGPGQNGCSPAQLVRRNLTPGHGPPSCSAPPIHSTSSSTSSSSINRSQRCGVCRGCQCKPCGLCTYCQDSPQFGGPGVKKQSCIERRCLRVLENRLQRDAPTFKARIGCNSCEDCRSPDCQICLVCLDRRFFNCKYMAGALCAKKRCNNATALELPCSVERMSLKRPSTDGGGGGPSPHHHQNSQQMVAKRQVLAGIPQQSAAGNIAHSHNVVVQHQLNSNIARILSAASGGDSIGQQQKFGRSSNNSNSTNSPLSECGGGGAGGLPPPSQSTSPPSALQMPSTAMVAQLGRPPFCWGASPTQMLGHQYPFDQMASLAAAAAVGFPQHHQVMAANYPNPYQPKFLNYPKYEYFTSEDGPQIATMANGVPPSSIISDHHLHNHSNRIGADGQQIGNGGNGQGEGGGGGGGTVSDNLLVPPSYSDVQKVVLQPL